MSSREEVARPLIDVPIDVLVRARGRPVGEVVRPANQHAVQLITHVFPGRHVGGHERFADLGLEALHLLLGRARAQVPLPVLLEPVRSERVAKEVEALLAGVFQRGLRLVDGQPELVITAFVHASASAARPRLRITKSSA